jgi:hypothetical protein
MKFPAIAVLCLLLAGCLIGHQQMQPDPNIGASVYCYAVADDEMCFAEAKQLCPRGYAVDEFIEIAGTGHKRLSFHCDAH